MSSDSSCPNFIDKLATVICRCNRIRSPVLLNISQLRKKKSVLLLHLLPVGEVHTFSRYIVDVSRKYRHRKSPSILACNPPGRGERSAQEAAVVACIERGLRSSSLYQCVC
jgi:hypothetical protein